MLQFFSGKVNKFINWIYSNNGYYSLKSGLYLDSIVKQFSQVFTKNLFFFYGLIFSDIYLINRLINGFLYNWARVNSKVLDLKKNSSVHSPKYFVFFLIIFLVTILFFL